jgi:hypothetical protein
MWKSMGPEKVKIGEKWGGGEESIVEGAEEH